MGVGGTIYNNHTLEPFKELGLDFQTAKKLASKLHAHFVNYAAKLVQLYQTCPFQHYFNCHQGPVPVQACNPFDPH